MPSEISSRADFSIIRYAQVWEDADVLLEALAIQPEDECLSIASAGDNALAMLARGPRRVVALDLSSAQLACLELRVAAFRELSHPEVLELIGSNPSDRRRELYLKARPALSDAAREFWDSRGDAIAQGIGHAGKFENYFRLFRERVLPLVHSKKRIANLLAPKSSAQREEFYSQQWDTWRWKLLFKLFFSRTAMGRLGRDPSFFRYVEGSVSERILSRTRHALTELSPHSNPYLRWILTGGHSPVALPFYLREENFDSIRAHLDRLEWHQASVEDYLARNEPGQISKFNLSDIFEYMSQENTSALLGKIASAARPGGRLAYWNMLAPRSSLDGLNLRPLRELATRLLLEDKAFFYSAFIVEEVQ